MATPTLGHIDAKEARNIELSYDFAAEKMSVIKDPTSKVKTNKLKCKPGDLLTFSCDEGTLSLKLEPASAFKPSSFATGGPPVEVLRRLKPGEKGMIWCGGEFRYKEGAIVRTKAVDRAD